MKMSVSLFLLLAVLPLAVSAQQAAESDVVVTKIVEVEEVEIIEAPASASAEQFDHARYNAILSKLQSMGHGYYTAAEWKEVDDEVNALVSSARRVRDGDAIIKTAVLKAMVLADMRRDYPPALAELRDARKTVKRMKNVDASRLYVKEADVLSQMGDAAAIEKLIAEYKASPDYRPESYAWSGGYGPNDPLLVVRPGFKEKTSLPLTMMEQSLRLAKTAPGLIFPDIQLQDIYGRTFRTADFRGNIVLVDFFARGWHLWEQNLPQMRDVYERFSGKGFSIISICLQVNPAGLEQLNLPWHLIPSAKPLTKALSVIEPTNYLLNRDGVVIARNLRGSDLAAAVRIAMED